MSIETGKLIIFEGPDGVGKTTQISLAQRALQQSGIDVLTRRGHGGTPIGEELRSVSLGDTPRTAQTDLLISMAIHSELQTDLHTRRKAGDNILLDRASLSMWAYQVYGSGLAAEEAADYIDKDLADFDPDLIICYRAGLATLRTRMRQNKSKADYFEGKSDTYFERVIKGYDFASERYEVTTIDAEQTLDHVHSETMQAIATIL